MVFVDKLDAYFAFDPGSSWAARGHIQEPGHMTTSSYSTADFAAHLAGAPNGLGSVIAITRQTRTVLCLATHDDHAAHAVEIIAGQKGLTVKLSGDDGRGLHVIHLTGFAATSRYSK